MKPLSAGASQSESLSLLHQRLRVAEGQGAELAKRLGVSGDEQGAEFMDSLQSKALVARVCRLESLLHALKLNVFRIETTRDLTSSHTAHLQEQLTALQEQCEEEQRSSQREAMRLRDQLQQEREEAQRETRTLREQLHASYRSQMDVSVAADELKKVKGQLSRKLYQTKEELVQETAARLEAEQSHDALLQRLKETEGEVKLLQTKSHALNADGQEARAELEEKAELIERLQEECQHLRQQLEEKDILTSDLSTELKIVKITLQKQQKENGTLTRGREESRAATDKVQALNDQLEAQCSDLSSALRSLTEEKAQLQASLKVRFPLTCDLQAEITAAAWSPRQQERDSVTSGSSRAENNTVIRSIETGNR
ncbi:coiled-coil domain-containing protein 150 isoform X1 [Tachysurus ichikawai]